MDGSGPSTSGTGADGDAALAALLATSRAYKASKALNVAAKLDLFTLLHSHPQGLSAAELGSRLGLCQRPGFRGAVDFFDLLVGIGYLVRDGDGAGATYHCHPTASRYLVRGSPEYVGGILQLNNDRSYVHFEYLEHALQHGEMPPEAAQRVPSIHATFGSDEAAAAFFAEGMAGASLGNFRRLAELFDFGSRKSLGDFGGSSGVLCCCVCQRHPHMTAVTYDLPPVHSVAVAHVRSQGLEERVQVRDWDFFSDAPFPLGHDVITMGMVLHDWGLARKKLLMRKAFDALPPGGAFIGVDNLVDDERRARPLALAMSLTMLLEFGGEDSFDYSFREFDSWAREVGFTSCSQVHLVGSTYAAIAIK